ncbi:MAG: UDP-N-acetylglucosamine 2-epimerase (non-hydrolyzing) [bacterium]|nr:UDP-N-acetylglucosamine 2-epimerase (non-hydrolyzing) [bacterium]
MKVATIIGTRPEIIRLSECIKLFDKVFDHTLIHTGQNYDYELNQIFFEELGLREPDKYLSVAGKHLGDTIGNVIRESYEVLRELMPEAILVLGDTNSVLCTISAKRLKIPIFHMEAGNRCFDLNVPEEINRKISDHISDINLTYTEHSRRYLLSEGFRKDHIFVTGSPLYEVLKANEDKINSSNVLEDLGLEKNKFFVVSSHREENLDLKENFKSIIEAINALAEEYRYPIIFSMHPRTRKKIDSDKIHIHEMVRNIQPLGFIDYVRLQQESTMVLSDSGTISEESAMIGFKAISIRTSTERPEAIDSGTVILGSNHKKEILQSVKLIQHTTSDYNRSVKEYSMNNVSSMVARIIQSYTPIINRVNWNKDL